MAKYSIGIHYGALTGRALLVNAENGSELATAVKEYSHKTMADCLQHPMDYLEILSETIPAVIAEAGVDAADVIGIGIDFATSAILPVMSDGTPLCFFKEFAENPHAYVKLPKHRPAEEITEKLISCAEKRGEAFLAGFKGMIDGSWMLPKVMELVTEAPEVYETCDCIIEAADWIVWQLTGNQSRNSCMAAWRALYDKKEGYPVKSFLEALDSRLSDFPEKKLNCRISPSGSCAGTVSAFVAGSLGLSPDTKVAVSVSDTHAVLPAVKIDAPGKMLSQIGSSSTHIMLGDTALYKEGICGAVEDELYPGLYSYEAYQAGTGSLLNWFTENCVPASYHEEARKEMITLQELLGRKAQALLPGESGLIALDWWSGNRSVLADKSLSGLFLGMTLNTKPEEMYLALIEATAFGLKTIIDRSGIPVNEVYAVGDFARNDPFMMQIYADILGLPIYIAGSKYPAALGSAILGALSAGAYPDIFAAASAMGSLKDTVYAPRLETVPVYSRLYSEYLRLHDYFGSGFNGIMKRLANISEEAKNAKNTETGEAVEANTPWEDPSEEPEYDEPLPTLDSEFGDILKEDDSMNEYSEEVKTAAAAAAKELFEAIDAVAAIRDDAEIYAAFKELIEEEADRHTNEIIAAADEVASSLDDAETEAYFDEIIKEQAEKNTREIIAAADEVAKLMEDAEHQAVFGEAIEEEAEKSTREILNAVDEVVKLMEDADKDAAGNGATAEEINPSAAEPAENPGKDMATETMNKVKKDESAGESNRFASLYGNDF